MNSNELEYLRTLLQVKRNFLEKMIEGRELTEKTLHASDTIEAYNDVLKDIERIEQLTEWMGP